MTILTFHRVSNEPDVLWPPMRVDVFERMMAFLAKETAVVSLESLPSLSAYPDKPLICISFDDGYLDFYENALPILQKYGLPCHHNICPGLIDAGKLPWTADVSHYLMQHPGASLTLPDGEVFNIPLKLCERDFLTLLEWLYPLPHATRAAFVADLQTDTQTKRQARLMTWDEVRACQQAGVTFGSHGMWHNHLPTIQDDALLDDEITGSRKRIADELGNAPDSFCFPSGFTDARCLGMVGNSGYQFALLCEDQVVTHPLSKENGLYGLTRINMANGCYAEETLRAFGFHAMANALLN